MKRHLWKEAPEWRRRFSKKDREKTDSMAKGLRHKFEKASPKSTGASSSRE